MMLIRKWLWCWLHITSDMAIRKINEQIKNLNLKSNKSILLKHGANTERWWLMKMMMMMICWIFYILHEYPKYILPECSAVPYFRYRDFWISQSFHWPRGRIRGLMHLEKDWLFAGTLPCFLKALFSCSIASQKTQNRRSQDEERCSIHFGHGISFKTGNAR